MALVVNTNIASLNSQYSLSQSRSALEQAMERLSSGSKINSAGDDAAGLAISTRMESQVRGLESAISNANDGISLLQTAEGAMEEITSMLQRMRELSIQASNGVNNDSDRQALNAEAQQLLAEIDRVVGDTTFNNQSILDGSMRTSLQVGSEAGQSLAVSLGNLSTYALGSDQASSSAMVQREAAVSGKAVGTTDAFGKAVVATTVNLGFESDDTYNFVLTTQLTNSSGTLQDVAFDISGVVSGGSARDIANQINDALRQPPTMIGTSGAGTPSTVYSSASELVEVSYSGNTVTITNKLGADVKIEAGNHQSATGISDTISGNISESGGLVRFTPVQPTEADGSAISGTYTAVVLGAKPDYVGDKFKVQDAPLSTSGSSTSTSATAATLKFNLADLADSTFGAQTAVSSGDTIAFRLVDETGQSTLVFTDQVTELSSGTDIKNALNNALVAAGADSTYAVTESSGTFTMTRADGTNFTMVLDDADGTPANSFSNTNAATNGVSTLGFIKDVVDLSAGATYQLSDEDITFNFADTVAGSVGASTIIAAGDDFKLTLTDETGTAHTIKVENLQNGSAATVAAAINTALLNAGIDDTYTASEATTGNATAGITLTHEGGQAFSLKFSEVNIAASGTVIHERLSDLDITSTVDDGLYSTNGIRANVVGTSTTTTNTTTMHLDVLGADKYTLNFADENSAGATADMVYTYDGTAASLDTFASKIAANLATMGSYDFTVTAADGRITITENGGLGFSVNKFASEGAGRILASADSSLIKSGDKSAVMLDDASWNTVASADAGVAGSNVSATQMQLTFNGDGDTYSFNIETSEGVARVNPFKYEGTSGADAVAAVTVALQAAGLDGFIQVKDGGTAAADANQIELIAQDGSEIRISNFTSVGSGQMTVESLAGSQGSGVTRILSDDLGGSPAALANLDISTSNGAVSALDAIDRAIQAVSDERANIGALTNRLDHTINNLGNIVVNTSAAQSRIQDADFASEAAELAKAQVLQQAGTAILAQANASVQSVLSLLG